MRFPRPRRRNSRQSQPQLVSELLGEVVARLGGAERGHEQRVFASYAQVVGDVFARRSRPERLRERVLYVRVESAALAHELVLRKAEVIARLDAAVGAGTVTDLRTRVGPLDT